MRFRSLDPFRFLRRRVPRDLSERIVRGALARAVENGYEDDLSKMTAEQLTRDLRTFDPECERLTDAEVLPEAEAWLAARRSP